MYKVEGKFQRLRIKNLMSISSHFCNFVTLFLVIIGDGVTKILHNILFIFSFCLAHLALQMKKIVQKITQPK